MTPDQLRELFPRLRDESFADASNGRLLSWARIYISLYNLVAFNSLDAVYGDRKIYRRKIDTLFRMLQNRCGSERDAVLRARMIQAMFSLVCGIVAPVDFKKKAAYCTAADALVRDHLQTGSRNLLEETVVCQCITDLLYPGPDSGDEYFQYHQACIAAWVGSMASDGSWQDVPVDIALERIGAMNRNSYMFLVKSCDRQIRQAFEYYRKLFPIPSDPGNFDANSLPVLGRLYDVAMQGNAYPIDRDLTPRIVLFMQEYGALLPCCADTWYFCTSYTVKAACQQITDLLQSEIMQHIA